MAQTQKQHHVVSVSAGTGFLACLFLLGAGGLTLMLHDGQAVSKKTNPFRPFKGEIGDAPEHFKDELGPVNVDATHEEKNGLFSRLRARRQSRWGRVCRVSQPSSQQWYRSSGCSGMVISGSAIVSPSQSTCPPGTCQSEAEIPQVPDFDLEPEGSVEASDLLDKPVGIKPDEEEKEFEPGDEPVQEDNRIIPTKLRGPSCEGEKVIELGPVNFDAVDEVKTQIRDSKEEVFFQEEVKEQKLPLTDESETEIVVLFTHADWKGRPEEERVIKMVQSDEFQDFLEDKFFRHITTNDVLFHRRYSIPQEDLPVLFVQWPDGGYYYKAINGEFPRSQNTLIRAIEEGRRVDPRLDGEGIEQEEGSSELKPDFTSDTMWELVEKGPIRTMYDDFKATVFWSLALITLVLIFLGVWLLAPKRK